MLTVIMGVLSSACVNRYLGPSLKGEYSYLINIVNIIVVIANLGFYQSYPNQKRKGMKNQLNKYMDAFAAQFILYIIVVAVLSFFAKDAAQCVALFIIPIQVLANQLAMIALVEFIKFRQETQIIMLFINFIMNLCLFLFFPVNIIFSLLVLMFKDIGFIIAYLFKTQYIPNPLRIDVGFIQYLARFGIYAMVSTLLLQLNYKLDILFLGNMITSYEVGLYSVGVALAECVWLIPDAFKDVLFSRTARSNSVNEIITSIKINFWVVLLIILGMFFFGRYAIWILYGKEYLQAFNVTCILFLGIPAMVIFKLTNPLYLANGHQKFFCVVLFISVLINCVMNSILIPFWGNNGAAVASVCSYSICGFAFYIRFIKEYNIKWYKPFILTKEDINHIVKIIRKGREKA